MSAPDKEESVKAIGEMLLDKSKPLKDRFRALFTLRNLGGPTAIECISRCFGDDSALLKHELAYCLGQMQDTRAIPTLNKILEDKSQEAMVRHEAGEALGAIGAKKSLDILEKFATDAVIEVAETCELAIRRIQWLTGTEEKGAERGGYTSVDPAPPSQENNIESLKRTLLDEELSLFQRYRAMFSLRNIGGEKAVLALADGLVCRSALFRHEIAYVLGQIQDGAGVEQLSQNLHDPSENAMVRHECAEALGAIATPESMRLLRKYLDDNERVVRESCVVALDISEYEKSEHFQYANSLSKLSPNTKESDLSNSGD